MDISDPIREKLQALEEKYAQMGQDMLSYLDGLLQADYLTYWDYVHLDTLLSLQNPRTSLPDEKIFIIYHQITELYFKLMLLALEQLLAEDAAKEPAFFLRQVGRLNRYLEQLVHSFDIMVEGMDKEEFLKFRMSLLPSSGFQSAQFRAIEIRSTDLYRLVHPELRRPDDDAALPEDIYARLYWKSGATELATGKKTLTLRHFDRKYRDSLIRLAERSTVSNLWQCYLALEGGADALQPCKEALRSYDHLLNVQWRLSHLRAASRYLERMPRVIAATGGTNWQQYLPPQRQRVVFFPDLWTGEELRRWGSPG